MRVVRGSRSIILALVAALLAATTIYLCLASAGAEVAVLVAATDIPALTQLQLRHLRTASLPAAAVHPHALTFEDQAAGRYALVPIAAGEQVLDEKLSRPGGAGGAVAAALRPGQRAMFVPAPLEVGLGGALRPGDRVDAIFVADERRVGQTASLVILRQIAVLDVRTTNGQAIAAAGRDDPLAGVVVAVSPAQAERLALALETGTIYLVAACYGAESEPPTPGAVLEDLFTFDGSTTAPP